MSALPISAAQCRMARAALSWSLGDLATASSIGASTISRFEQGKSIPTDATVAAIRNALEAAGVEFLPDSTVRYRRSGRRAYTYRVVRLADGTYGIEVLQADGKPEIVQRFRTERDARAWIGEEEP
jgi:transcriptional regulator with XRE-family HTH domain